MSDSNDTPHYSPFDLFLAGTILAAAVGYVLFGPRRSDPALECSKADSVQDRIDMINPCLIAPVSSTIH